jgi:hypothetical protein
MDPTASKPKKAVTRPRARSRNANGTTQASAIQPTKHERRRIEHEALRVGEMRHPGEKVRIPQRQAPRTESDARVNFPRVVNGCIDARQPVASELQGLTEYVEDEEREGRENEHCRCVSSPADAHRSESRPITGGSIGPKQVGGHPLTPAAQIVSSSLAYASLSGRS